MARNNWQQNYEQYCRSYYQWYLKWLHSNFTGPVNAHGYSLYGLSEPQCPADAANKQYVDNHSQQSDRGGTITLSQDEDESEKITTITYAQLANLPRIILSLTNIRNLRDRLLSYYVQNVTNTSFELVSKMQANYGRIVVNAETNSGSAHPQLLSIAGYPSLAYTTHSGFHALRQANNNIGNDEWNNITPLSGIGPEVAIIGGKPASAYLNATGTALIYTRSSNANGIAVWNEIEINLPNTALLQGSLWKITELNGGPYILLVYVDVQRESNSLAIINPNANGSGPWTITETGTWPRRDAELLSITAIGHLPAIAYNNANWFPDIVYAQASNPDGSGPWSQTIWQQVNSREYTAVNLLAVAGGPCIVLAHYGFNNVSPALIVAFGPDNKFTIDTAGPNYVIQNLSIAIIDGNLAIAYSMVNGLISVFNRFYEIKYARADNSDPANNPNTEWFVQKLRQYDQEEIIDIEISLNTINDNPAIVFSLNQTLRYIRAGNRNQFVENAEYKVDWTST